MIVVNQSCGRRPWYISSSSFSKASGVNTTRQKQPPSTTTKTTTKLSTSSSTTTTTTTTKTTNTIPIHEIHKKAWDAVRNGDILTHSQSLHYHHTTTTNERKLLSDSVKPLRIHLETSSLQRQQQQSSSSISLLQSHILPSLVSIWSSHLSVPPTLSPIKIPSNVCFGMIDDDNIPSSLFTTGVPDTDLVIFISLTHCGGVSSPTSNLAYAFPCSQDQYDRPIVGSVTFCAEALSQKSTDDDDDDVKRLTEIAVHETGHILGLSSNLFPYFRDFETKVPLTTRPLELTTVTCVDGVRRSVVRPGRGVLRREGGGMWVVVTERVRTVVRNQFNCQELQGARLENQPTNPESCWGSHWDERYFYTEAMSPIYSTGINVLSPLTLALLEDSGWYVANYTTTPLSPFGHGAGCDFVEKRCIVENTVPDYGKGYFCDKESAFNENGAVVGDWVCDLTHEGMAICDLFRSMDDDAAATAGGYFDDPALIPRFEHADYCPIPHIPTIGCRDTSQRPLVASEVFGENSRCFNLVQPRNYIGALCLESYCNEETRKIEVRLRSGVVVTCDYDGQVHELPRTLGSGGVISTWDFECPRLASFCPDLFCPSNCSGKGICDYSLSKPKCVCFDPDDTSDGCFGNTIPSSSSSSPPPPPTSSPTRPPTPPPSSNQDKDDNAFTNDDDKIMSIIPPPPSTSPPPPPTPSPSSSPSQSQSPTPNNTQNIFDEDYDVVTISGVGRSIDRTWRIGGWEIMTFITAIITFFI